MDVLTPPEHTDAESRSGSTHTKQILFVDDEPHVLEGIKRLFRPMRERWTAHYESDPRAALARIEREPYDVVVSDMKMPAVSGLEVLRHTQQHNPRAVRIGLSGYAETELALEAAAVAHQFFAKPCHIKDLFEAIEQITAVADRLGGNELLPRITAGSCLPSPPDLYQRIMREASSPEGSLERVGEIIESDVAMTAKILSIVNSPFFGLANQATSPSQAAALIGFEGLRSIVLAAGIFQAYEHKIDVAKVHALLGHSIATSEIAGDVATLLEMPKREAEQSKLAGMLHDVGKLVLFCNASTAPRMLDAMLRSGIYREEQAEEELFGCCHSDTGAYLLSLWGFANPVVEAVAFHHRPAEAGGHRVPRPLTAVHIAEWLATPGDDAESADLDYLASLGIDTGDERWRRIVACAQRTQTDSEHPCEESP